MYVHTYIFLHLPYKIYVLCMCIVYSICYVFIVYTCYIKYLRISLSCNETQPIFMFASKRIEINPRMCVEVVRYLLPIRYYCTLY